MRTQVDVFRKRAGRWWIARSFFFDPWEEGLARDDVDVAIEAGVPFDGEQVRVFLHPTTCYDVSSPIMDRPEGPWRQATEVKGWTPPRTAYHPRPAKVAS